MNGVGPPGPAPFVSAAGLHRIAAVGFHVLADYPRRPILEFYRQVPSPFYGTTFPLDATKVRERARAFGMRNTALSAALGAEGRITLAPASRARRS